MPRNSMRENREALLPAEWKRASVRPEKARSHKSGMQGNRESSEGIVAAKWVNKGGEPPGGVHGAKALGQGEHVAG